MRAVTYQRQSVGDVEGIARQRERTHAEIARRGWTFVRDYVDDDVSATKVRGAGTAWADMLDADDYDVVVAVNLDRLLRTHRDLATLIDAGTKVTTLEGELDLTSASGEMQAGVLTSMARFEARRKSERQVRANDTRAAAGQWVGGRRPFGFDADGVTVRPDERSAIEWGFEAFIGGMNLTHIAAEWNRRGLVTGQGRPWERTAVRAVLRSPRYVGWVRRHGEVVNREAVWPAYVTEDVWEAAQARMAGAMGRTTRPTLLLTGVAVCGVCGATAHAGGNARKGVPAYRCSGSLGHFARRAEPVDEFVDDLVSARLDLPDVRDLVNATSAEPGLVADLEAARQRRDGLGAAFATGDLTAAQVRSATAVLDVQVHDLERRLADAARVRILGGVTSGDAYRALPTARRRAIIDLLLDVTLMPVGRGTRTFNPETVVTTWKASV